jgi:PAS domain S-box-containing protein
MAIQDASGRYLRVNDALCRMLGYAEQELLHLTFDDVTPPEERGAEAERDVAMLAGRMTSYQQEKRYLRQNGSVVWAHVSVSLLRGAADAATFLVQIQDITERRAAEAGRAQLEAQLRQAQKMEAVGQLAGGVAHDFNNLLAVIMGHSDLMLSVIDERDPLHQDAEAIRQASERAASLTHQLLAFSRRQLLQPQVVDLNALVEKMAGMLRRLIGEPIGLDTQLTPALGRVSADPGQIEQVVMNLALNARDAMPDGGRLLLATTNAVLDREFAERHPGAGLGPQVVLTVRDTGAGMSAETQARIFEPFFTTKEPGKGTGLGLSTVYGIVKQHRGYVGVQSAPGEGTTFRIYLPRVDAEPAPVPVGAGRATSPGGSETILLVEDEAAVRSLMRKMLAQQGYAMLEAPDGPAALEVASRHAGPIHLLLTDVVMPRMRGRELAERLRGTRPDVRVLFVSGYTDDALGAPALPSGAAFLTKPFAPDALLRQVRALLDAP